MPPLSQLPSSFEMTKNDSESSIGASVRSYLLPFVRYWWVCIPFIIASSYYKYYQLSKLPITYSSKAEMMLMGQLAIAENSYYREYHANFFGNEAELMHSPIVRDQAIERMKALYPQIVAKGGWANVQAIPRKDSSTFDLSASGNDPEYTRLFLDISMETYLSYRDQSRKSRTDLTLNQINIEIARLEREIQNEEDEIQNFKTTNNVIFIQEQASSASSSLVGIKKQLEDRYDQLKMIQLRKKNEQKTAEVTIPDDTLTSDALAQVNSPMFNALQRMQQLKSEQARFSKVLRDVHPKMKYFENEIKQIETNIEVYKRQFITEATKRAEVLKVEEKKREENLNLEIEYFSTLVESKEKECVELSRKLGEFERMNSRLERKKQLRNQKLSSIEGVNFAKNVVVEPISIVKFATPASAVRVDLFKETVNGGLIGLGIGLSIIFVFSRWTTTVYTEHDLPINDKAKPIAYIPRINFHKAKGRVPLLTPDDNRYAFMEAFRNLRSYILADYPIQKNNRAQFISVTSAIPSEGKSTVSSNLALLFAYSGHKTLLIDADMRQGTQHKSFNLENKKGLTELLQGKIEIKDCIQHNATGELDIITRGEAMMNSSELLLTNYCRSMFKEFESRYDYIIIDTPPVMATDDVANLVNYVDAIFIVARISLSTRKTLASALRMLNTRHGKIGGFVLNSCDATSTDYYRYKYYGNYGKAK